MQNFLLDYHIQHEKLDSLQVIYAIECNKFSAEIMNWAINKKLNLSKYEYMLPFITKSYNAHVISLFDFKLYDETQINNMVHQAFITNNTIIINHIVSNGIIPNVSIVNSYINFNVPLKYDLMKIMVKFNVRYEINISCKIILPKISDLLKFNMVNSSLTNLLEEPFIDLHIVSEWILQMFDSETVGIIFVEMLQCSIFKPLVLVMINSKLVKNYRNLILVSFDKIIKQPTCDVETIECLIEAGFKFKINNRMINITTDPNLKSWFKNCKNGRVGKNSKILSN